MTHLKRLLGFKSRIGFLSDMIAVVLGEGLAPARGARGGGWYATVWFGMTTITNVSSFLLSRATGWSKR
jgi:hypothetical protein